MFYNSMTEFYVVKLILCLKMDYKQSFHVLCDLYFSVFFSIKNEHCSILFMENQSSKQFSFTNASKDMVKAADLKLTHTNCINYWFKETCQRQ